MGTYNPRNKDILVYHLSASVALFLPYVQSLNLQQHTAMADFSAKAAAAFTAAGMPVCASELGTTEDWEGDSDSDNGSNSENGQGEDEEEETAYQLGFPEEGCNALHGDPDWRKWDGGRIGGQPTWLDPLNLPTTEQLQVCPSLSLSLSHTHTHTHTLTPPLPPPSTVPAVSAAYALPSAAVLSC